jgi:hypothetical protein
MDISKLLFHLFGAIVGVSLVLAALKSISTIKRALALSISNRMIRF